MIWFHLSPQNKLKKIDSIAFRKIKQNKEKHGLRKLPFCSEINEIVRDNSLDTSEFLTTYLTSNLGKQNMFACILKDGDSLHSVIF